MEILMAVFHEKDILETAAPQEFRSRVLVNKAIGKRQEN